MKQFLRLMAMLWSIGKWLLALFVLSCVVAHAQVPAGGTAAPDASGKDSVITKKDTLMLEEVVISTGYQRIPKERATGSFVFVDSALFNRTFSTDVLSRLEGIVPGLRFNRNRNDPDDINMTLRGPSTIQANDQPLIILDNFEYQGELNNLNPNDIANITVLKDAAASSIWGAKAGNGVIVITTKSGRYNQPTKLSFNSTFSTKDRQNLHANPSLNSSDYIDLEMDLFARGYYDRRLTDINKPPVSPVVWILAQQRSGVIAEQEANTSIDALRGIDTRDDVNKYLQQRSFIQQYALSLSGGGSHNQYYASVGWDDNRQQITGNRHDRLSLLFNNTIGLFNNRLEVKTGLAYTASHTQENGINPVPSMNYPYGRLVDERGMPLAIAQYNQGFLDTVGAGRLLDWHYRPLDELAVNDNSSKLTDIQANMNIGYRPVGWLRISALYQYASGNRHSSDYYAAESYYARDLINQFSSFAPNGEIIRPIPLGGILDQRNGTYRSHRARGQVDFQHSLGYHEFQALLGGEMSDRNTLGDGARYYGYDKETPNNIPVDAVNPYTSMVTGRQTLRISNTRTLQHLTDRFVSLFANASYGFDKKYWVTGSLRRDGSNLFGVRTNQQWNPLWSVGFKWVADREPFFDAPWLPALSLRLTYGSSGNIDRSVTAYLVGRMSGANLYGQPIMWLSSPPNPDLTWETVTTFNAAADFTLLKNRRIEGTIEYYQKSARNLMSPAELPAASGLLSYTGNTAATEGYGIDLTVTTHNTTGALRWRTTWQYSLTRDRVTEYRVNPANNNSYITGALMVGKPQGSLFAYRWAGLDPTNGNPLGYLNGEVSDSHSLIASGSDLQDIRFFGSFNAPHFGGVMNTFEWNRWSFSFNILFKGGAYFRRSLLGYSSLFAGNYVAGAADYAMRWQQPGDEIHTDVPSFVYPANGSRDAFYGYSEVGVERGDFIRLQDIRLSYDLPRGHRGRLGLPQLSLFMIASNVGLIWKATTIDFDPDYGFLNRQINLSAGLKINL